MNLAFSQIHQIKRLPYSILSTYLYCNVLQARFMAQIFLVFIASLSGVLALSMAIMRVKYLMVVKGKHPVKGEVKSVSKNKHGEMIATGETLEGETFNVQVPFWYKSALFLELVKCPTHKSIFDKVLPISSSAVTHILVRPKPIYLHTWVLITFSLICLLSISLVYNEASADDSLIPRHFTFTPGYYSESIFNANT